MRECDVLLLLPRDEAKEHQSDLDPAVRFCPFDKPRLRQPARQFLVAARVLRQIRRFRPDVVHFQHGHMWFNLAMPLLRSYPVVMTIHDPRHHAGDRDSRRTPQFLMDFSYRRADRVIVHGDAIKREVTKLVKDRRREDSRGPAHRDGQRECSGRQQRRRPDSFVLWTHLGIQGSEVFDRG